MRERGILVVAAAAAWMLARPMLHGASIEEPLAHGLYLLAYVIGPGWLAWRPFRNEGEDGLQALGMAWTIGWVLQALSFVALRILGATEWFGLYPLAFAPLLLRTGAPSPGAAVLRSRDAGLLLAILLVTLERTPLSHAAAWWSGHSHDLLFHAGNAAELRDHWPLRDPRAASLPLNYHFLAYAVPAGESAVTGLGVHALLARVGAGWIPLLLVLQVFNAGRAFGGRTAAGLAAAGIVALTVDLGAGAQLLWPARAHALRFGSTLDTGIWSSLTTSSGLVLFASLAIVVRRWLEDGRALPPREVAAGALLAFAASGTKGSVMPVVCAGLAAFAIAGLARGRRCLRPALGALAAISLAALPASLFLALGEGAWASSIFAFDPGAAARGSGFFEAASRRLPEWAGPLLVAPWIVGHLGFAGAAVLLRRPLRAAAPSSSETWLLLALAVGLVLALLLDATGRSQLFFLHNGQVALAVLAGVTLASATRPRTAAVLALLLFAVPTLAGAAADVGRALHRDASTPPPAPALAESYAEALEWIRTRTPEDSVFVARHGSIVVSCFGERRAFLETTRFTPAQFEQRGGATAHGDLARERERILGGEIGRAAPGGGTAVFLLQDDVGSVAAGGEGSRYEIRPAPLAAPAPRSGRLEPVFANEAARIWRFEPGP